MAGGLQQILGKIPQAALHLPVGIGAAVAVDHARKQLGADADLVLLVQGEAVEHRLDAGEQPVQIDGVALVFPVAESADAEAELGEGGGGQRRGQGARQAGDAIAAEVEFGGLSGLAHVRLHHLVSETKLRSHAAGGGSDSNCRQRSL
jgi:hypothetical protein